MDIDEIKNLMDSDNGKFIIIENGKPVFVIMSFEDYKNILAKKNNNNKEYEEDDEQDIEDSQDDDIAEADDPEQETRDQGIEFPGQLEY